MEALLSEGEEFSDAVTVGKFIVPWSSRIARPDGVCRSRGSGLLTFEIVVDDVEMFFDMCTGVTEGQDCVVIVSFCAMFVYDVSRDDDSSLWWFL